MVCGGDGMDGVNGARKVVEMMVKRKKNSCGGRVGLTISSFFTNNFIMKVIENE